MPSLPFRLKCRAMRKSSMVQYNPMIHESVFGCLSLHRSRKEAEMEMEFHKHQRMKEDDYSDVERWTIYEYKLK